MSVKDYLKDRYDQELFENMIGDLGQSKKASFVESLVNVAIGYLVALGSQIVVFPLFGIHIPFKDNILIGLWFTAISIVRSYIIRRWFNKR